MTEAEPTAGEYTIRPLNADTWDAFAAFAERHNGVWGGCWCTWFHRAPGEKGQCQYGTPEELPNIYHRKQYEAGLDRLPDYRLTCFFVDKKYRRKGMAAVVLRGALELIARAGGGLVEAYPQDTGGKKISASFLYNGTRSLFEQAGFTYDRPKGLHHCVMSKRVREWQGAYFADVLGVAPPPGACSR